MAPGPGSKKRASSTSASQEKESPGLDLSNPSPPAGGSDGESVTSSAVHPAPASGVTGTGGTSYTVVARRYRPQRFEDVVGQDHVVQALRNAIRLNRLAQAYLFCGTRGVGKTSMARIFAKCLNCVQGPTESPCQVCNICQDIASGQDVDVIEIDGASNNGVEQVRELRQNASLRPSRSRFKIYYIDEVHMLSTGAFNALLKTLEEPPPHVKFFFATTEANKIPITVLSRCQRYDFAGITPEAIVNTLVEICAREGVETEPEALQVVARRAGGSMRDAQSLLEQLLASGSPRLTVEVVHTLLGTPSDERLLAMLEALAGRDAAGVLSLLDRAAAEGVQPTDFLAGVLDFLRDAMVLAVGAGAVVQSVTPRQKPRLQGVVDRWSIDAILAALQILAEARARMRGVSHGRLLAELALVRVARLENLSELGEMIDRLAALESGSPLPPRSEAPSVKKKLTPDSPVPSGDTEPAVSSDSPGRSSSATPTAASDGASAAAPAQRKSHPTLELARVHQVWEELVKKVGVSLGMRLSQAAPIAVEETDVLVIGPRPGYNSLVDACGTDESLEKISHCLQRLLRRPVSVRYERASEPSNPGQTGSPGEPRRGETLAADPMIQKVVELFEARPLHLEYDDDSDAN